MIFFRKRQLAFKYAFQGIKFFLEEAHPRIHLAISVLTLILSFVLNLNTTEWILIIICIGMVLSLEAINSALEHFVDLVSPEQNTKAGLVKDISAGAVLIGSIAAFVIGILIFAPKVISLF